MYLVLGGITALSILGYTSYVRITESVQNWREEARSEGLSKGRREGRLDGLSKGRLEGQQEGIREVLGNLVKLGPSRVRRMCLENGIQFTEKRNSGNDHREIEHSLRREIQEEFREELRQYMKRDTKKEVEKELRAEYRKDLTKTGMDMAIVAAARFDMKEETRLQLKKELRSSVRLELREDERYSVRQLLYVISTKISPIPRESLSCKLRLSTICRASH